MAPARWHDPGPAHHCIMCVAGKHWWGYCALCTAWTVATSLACFITGWLGRPAYHRSTNTGPPVTAACPGTPGAACRPPALPPGRWGTRACMKKQTTLSRAVKVSSRNASPASQMRAASAARRTQAARRRWNGRSASAQQRARTAHGRSGSRCPSRTVCSVRRARTRGEATCLWRQV